MGKNNSKIVTLLISFLLALLLWVYANNDSDNIVYSKIEDIPIVLTNTSILEQNDFIISVSTDNIDSMKIYGKGSLVKSLDNKNIQASVDLKDISSEGTYTLNINIKGVPNDVTIVDQNPNTIKVTVDKIGNKSLSVPVIKSTGQVKEGYSVLSLSSEVEDVNISGPSDSVDKVEAIMGNVDVTNKSGDFSSPATLYAVDANNKKIEDVTLSPATTNVKVSIGKVKNVPIKVKTSGSVMDGYKVTSIKPSVTTVTISGKDEILNTVNEINTESISLDEVNETFEKNVKLDIPQGIHIVNAKDSIGVNVFIDKQNQKTVYINSFTFDYLGSGLTAEVLDENISVLLSGEEEDLSSISEKNLTGSIDLSGLKEGEYNVDIKISTQGLPEGVSIKSVSQNSVLVKITKE
ncbi:CdaR family protein [Anaerofustis sp. HA2171]|uniref:CdaR family protein n=1 Tax=Anaerofustis butyriciformans TaxID=3108533 RepID=UPI002E31AADF|nr:CdaR family protein [Anaerofustis sp. HA2171]